jgi:catechol 2,3-dioxygenase-like lactoylglutathione lyase family enzyme
LAAYSACKEAFMLSKAPIIPYIPVSDVPRARKFYEQTLGLKMKEENPEGVLYECGKGSVVFVYRSAGAGSSKASVAFWDVAELDAEVAELRSKGVKLEDYDMPGVKTVNGIATNGKIKAAWFKDPDGNILALSQRS